MEHFFAVPRPLRRPLPCPPGVVRPLLRPLAGVLAVMFCCALWAHATTVDEKVTLERFYSERVQHVLENILGQNSVLVYVNLEVDSAQTQSEHETIISGSAGAGGGGDKFMYNMEKKYFLPGYPIDDPKAQNTATNGKMERVVDQTVGLPKTVIKRIGVTVVADNRIPKKDLDNIPKTVAGLLGLSKKRGDTIAIQQTPFPHTMDTLLSQLRNPVMALEVVKYITITSLAIICMMMLFFLARSFFKEFSVMNHTLKTKFQIEGLDKLGTGAPAAPKEGEKPALTEGEGNLLPEAIKPVEQPKVVYETAHFKFVEAKNLPRLVYLLRKETPENIAITTSFLSPTDSAYVMSALDPQVRSQVTAKLSNVIETSTDVVQKLEKNIEDKINYVLGGSDYMAEMVETADEKTQEQIIADVATTNPMLAERLRAEIFKFVDIEQLRDDEIKRVMQAVDREVLAMSLRNAGEELKNRFISNMTASGQAMFKETMDFMGPRPKSKIVESQRRVVNAVRHLMKEGLIAKRVITRVEAVHVTEEEHI